MFLSNSLYIGKSYTIFFYEKVVKWCSYQKLHKNPCEYKAPINSQPIRTGKFINFLIYMIVYSAWKRYNVRENTNMHILFGNYSEKIVYVCCRSLRGSVDWNIDLQLLSFWVITSLPPRERGLKYWVNIICYCLTYVAPSAGAWIEILLMKVSCTPSRVAPSAGAWIEIFSIQSHIPVILVAPSAGAWIEIVKQLNELLDKEVAPSAGAWIEIWSLT